VIVEWYWAGTADGGAEYPAALVAVGGAAEARTLVRAALGRLDCVESPGVGEATALWWPPGSNTAPAKVSGRRGPPEVAMAATATALTAVAATANHSAGA
jgi:hypothetical protein